MASRQDSSNDQKEPEFPQSVLSLRSKFESLSSNDVTSNGTNTPLKKHLNSQEQNANNTEKPVSKYQGTQIPPSFPSVGNTSTQGEKSSGSNSLPESVKSEDVNNEVKNKPSVEILRKAFSQNQESSSDTDAFMPSSPTASNSFISVSPLPNKPSRSVSSRDYTDLTNRPRPDYVTKPKGGTRGFSSPAKPNLDSSPSYTEEKPTDEKDEVEEDLISESDPESSSTLSSEQEDEGIPAKSSLQFSKQHDNPFKHDSETLDSTSSSIPRPPRLQSQHVDVQPPVLSPRPPKSVAAEAVHQSRIEMAKQVPSRTPQRPPKPPARKSSHTIYTSTSNEFSGSLPSRRISSVSSPMSNISLSASEPMLSSEKPKLPPRPSQMAPDISLNNMTNESDSVSPPPFLVSPQPGRSLSSGIRPTSSSAMSDAQDISISSGSPSTSQTDTILKGTLPDVSCVRRNQPTFMNGADSINLDFEARAFVVSGERLVLAGNGALRVYDSITGLCNWHMPLGDVKVTAMSFKPSGNKVADDGRFVWIGTRDGALWEIDVVNHHIVNKRTTLHTSISHILTCKNEVWTLDEAGRLLVWQEDRIMGLSVQSDPKSVRIVPHASHAMVLDDNLLWAVVGKSIYVYDPANTERPSILQKPMTPPGLIGDISCGTAMASFPDLVFYGHVDGKISIYSKTQYRFMELVTSSSFYRISSLVGVGSTIWAAYTTGMIYVFDASVSPWRLLKTWHAHKVSQSGANTILGIDVNSIWKAKRLQVVSLCSPIVKFWDGLMMGDWLSTEMRKLFPKYSSFEDITALVCSWNAGASKPSEFRSQDAGPDFIKALLEENGYPDIVIFGFQELVDLENKKLTAKSLLSSSTKNSSSNSDNISRQYRLWREKLESEMTRCDRKYGYQVLVCENLVGLFSCIFVKSALQSKVRMLQTTTVKTGLGGLHGNKGAIVVRFLIDDTSFCIVNCHLAAGQTSKAARNNDLATILDSAALTPESNEMDRLNFFEAGGDGSQILDHEVCILHGDLNYRINLLRPKVNDLLKKNDIKTLLQSDQLTQERKRNAGFRLRTFSEPEITFAPTYKYDVNSDRYDSSEKKRVPAWCDRICFRGDMDYIHADNYRRHEVRASDHRPVSALIHAKVKLVNAQEQASTWDVVKKKWLDYADSVKREAKLHYLMVYASIVREKAERILVESNWNVQEAIQNIFNNV
ncbi:inositol polyphosphate phosphatase [Schizosaccharomyces cryophilus OY26]|uniref:Inositol polyphosphate phosphatase n=1 Tax=Schizosaccharomyces cryophilus (strain OY26 / ATCC MYA-4695 / CBS 11777 / NBRC 106824 / NRRL Y48691) TaxID=653667 RepID=S9X3K0_SCHCR|nr:inositol polyphosphate phosphatase [Schizosaccharomyces cryophilus OY26]EPY51682.1 inositol polyphosphate phosphatase [Schizosaccharomyces cryophilus OY26]